MMKFKCFILCSLSFLPLSQLTHAQENKQVKINKDLSIALSQIDTDGEYLKIRKSGEFLKIITNLLDKYLLPEMFAQGSISEHFSFDKILKISGIDQISASSESVKKSDSIYLTKHFFQTNGSRTGLLSFLGKKDLPWASLEYAPADTAFLLETHLDMTAIPQIMKQLAPLMEESMAEKILATLAEKDPISNIAMEKIMLQMDARISLIATLDESKSWGPPNATMPAVNATGRIDGIARFLWENYSPAITHSLPVTSEGNIHTILSPQVIESPWGPLTPIVVIDTDTDQIWFSVSEQHLKRCLSAQTKITDNPEFQLTNKKSPTTGASRLYLSKRLTKIAALTLQAKLKEELDSPAANQAINDAVNYLGTLSSISSCLSHDNKGIHIQTYAPFPLNSDQSANLQNIMAFSGLAYGPIMKQLNAANNIEAVVNVRSISTELTAYYRENKQYPASLEQLVDNEFITEEFFTVTNLELHYIKGLDISDASKIILYTSSTPDGKIIISRVDGSTEAISRAEFDQLRTQQKIKK